MARGRPIVAGVVAASVLGGCAAPRVQPAPPEMLQQGPLAFLQDGHTAREEVILRLGTPMAKFEGERILTYAFHRDAEGKWQRVGRWTADQQGRFDYAPGTCSLVLVFGPEGTLVRHSLVLAQ